MSPHWRHEPRGVFNLQEMIGLTPRFTDDSRGGRRTFEEKRVPYLSVMCHAAVMVRWVGSGRGVQNGGCGGAVGLSN